MKMGELPEPERVWAASALEILRESIVSQAMDDLERPHIVLIDDPELDLAFVLGPFADALSATVAADAQRQEDLRELGESGHRTYRVLVLLPPVLAVM
jgi:hypothetical protein